jgi:hypothetical protein
MIQPPLNTETSDDGELAKIRLANLTVPQRGEELTVFTSALSSMQTSLAVAKQ